MTPLQEIENNLRFVKLERSKVEHEIRQTNSARCEALQYGDKDKAGKLNNDRGQQQYTLVILRIAYNALEQLQLALEERARLNEMLDEPALTDVESEPSPIENLNYSVVDFDKPPSPSSWGCCD